MTARYAEAIAAVAKTKRSAALLDGMDGFMVTMEPHSGHLLDLCRDQQAAIEALLNALCQGLRGED